MKFLLRLLTLLRFRRRVRVPVLMIVAVIKE